MGTEKEHTNQSTPKSRGDNEALEPLFCELAVVMNEELRHIRFISTKELRKLHTCHNAQELGKYFETEKKILEYIFVENPEYKNKSRFQTYIPLNPKNIDILDLIESYVSVDYIRHASTDGKNEDTIVWFNILAEKGENNNFSISDIKAVNR